VRILLWHVHGGWTTSFVQGSHEYLLPVTPDRGPDGLGRAGNAWPANAREVPLEALREEEIDVVVLQRTQEIPLAEHHLERRPGAEIPAVYVEHNTPKGDVPVTRHPLAEQDSIAVVHVSHFNDLFWDSGRAPRFVVEHGVPDPEPLWTGDLVRGAVVVNEPGRRGRVTGTDLLPRLSHALPLDVYGMKTEPGSPGFPASDRVVGRGDTRHDVLLTEMARRRAYVHTCRWTSLGLSLVEAMHLGMPVAALGTTEAPDALAGSGAIVSTDVERLVAGLRLWAQDPDAAADAGRRTREVALARYSLARFLSTWDAVLEEVIR
jgi:hypothetical protein